MLFPYAGTYQPGQVPEHVILRQADYDRLLELAKSSPPAGKGLLVLTGAVHHIAFSTEQGASLVSDLELTSTIHEASTWKVPIAGAHDISATVDGREVPVFIEAGGQQAGIPIPGAGSFKLQVRRTAIVKSERQATSLEFPVNLMPSARLTLERFSRLGPLRFVSAHGKVEVSRRSILGSRSRAC